jgi:threonine dehydrogenase-like Zn-dependent dehydrogenase
MAASLDPDRALSKRYVVAHRSGPPAHIKRGRWARSHCLGAAGVDEILTLSSHAVSPRKAATCTRPNTAARSGGFVGFDGVPHEENLAGDQLFSSHVGLRGGPAPMRPFRPQLVGLVFDGSIDPGKAFDLTLPLDAVAEAYRAMDERRAIKALLQP